MFANFVPNEGAIDFRITGDDGTQTLQVVSPGNFTEYHAFSPGVVEVEMLRSGDGTALGHYRLSLENYRGQALTIAATADSARAAGAALVALDSSGTQVSTEVLTTGVAATHPVQQFVLHPNYPNPFNPETTLRYELPQKAEVRLVIYDVAGRFVRTLVSELQPAGSHMVTWDGRNAEGQELASGVYVARFSAGKFTDTVKMLLVK